MADPREHDERLADWVDGRMSAEQRARFEAELDADPAAAAAAARYRDLVARVRGEFADDPTAAPAAEAELTARIVAAATVGGARLLSWPRLAAVAAAVVVAAGAWWLGRPAAPPVTEDAPVAIASAEAAPERIDVARLELEEEKSMTLAERAPSRSRKSRSGEGGEPPAETLDRADALVAAPVPPAGGGGGKQAPVTKAPVPTSPAPQLGVMLESGPSSDVYARSAGGDDDVLLVEVPFAFPVAAADAKAEPVTALTLTDEQLAAWTATAEGVANGALGLAFFSSNTVLPVVQRRASLGRVLGSGVVNKVEGRGGGAAAGGALRYEHQPLDRQFDVVGDPEQLALYLRALQSSVAALGGRISLQQSQSVPVAGPDDRAALARPRVAPGDRGVADKSAEKPAGQAGNEPAGESADRSRRSDEVLDTIELIDQRRAATAGRMLLVVRQLASPVQPAAELPGTGDDHRSKR